MSIMPMRLFQGTELTTKIQELAYKDTENYYSLEGDEIKKYILTLSKQKTTKESELSKGFWHFFFLHEPFITASHKDFLLQIHGQISLFSQSDDKIRCLQKIEQIATIHILSQHPLHTIKEARGLAATIEGYMREERFGLVGELLTNILNNQRTATRGFTILSNLMAGGSRFKLHEIFSSRPLERPLETFGCLSYSTYCNSLEKILHGIKPELKTLCIGWGNSVEQLIEYKIFPLILQQTKLETLLLGTKDKDSHPRDIDLSSIQKITSLQRLKLYNVSAKEGTGNTILNNSSLKELTIFDNASCPIVGQILSGKKPERLNSLYLEGNRQYTINAIASFTRLTKLVVIPQPFLQGPAGFISLPRLNELTGLETLSLYGDGFDCAMVSEFARDFQNLKAFEIKLDHLSLETFFALLSHPGLKRLRITTNALALPKTVPTSSLEELIIRIDQDYQDIDKLAQFVKSLSSVKKFSIVCDSCTESTYQILKTRVPQLDTLSFVFSDDAPFESEKSTIKVYNLRTMKNDDKYRQLMVTWHESFPLTL